MGILNCHPFFVRENANSTPESTQFKKRRDFQRRKVVFRPQKIGRRQLTDGDECLAVWDYQDFLCFLVAVLGTIAVLLIAIFLIHHFYAKRKRAKSRMWANRQRAVAIRRNRGGAARSGETGGGAFTSGSQKSQRALLSSAH